MNLAPTGKLLRVVLDSNILVAAVISPRGPNAAIWNAARAGRYCLLTSPDLIRELVCVLRSRFEWAETELQRLVRVLARRTQIIPTHTRLTIITADLDDDRVLECATMTMPTSSFPMTTTYSI